MGKALADFGIQAAQDVVGAGLGLALGGINDKRQLKQQRKLQRLEIEGQKEMLSHNMAAQLKMWQDTNYSAQMEQLRKAGLNPGMIYGMSGGGATTTGQASANVTGAHAPTGGGEAIAMASTAAQLGLMRAQKENIEADTQAKLAGIPKTGAEIPNIQADTENKILQGIILKYTGKEAKDFYEQVKTPNRGIEAKTYQDELEARQGIATTIYEMWTEGKLKDKANYEIEQLLVQNAKTRMEARHIQKAMDLLEENIKGAKLDNVIKDLEARLQTETGIDKSSSGLLKILGRLFLKLTGK